MATRVKTLRLPEDVIETIETFPGESFTDKFVAAARLLGRDRELLIRENNLLEEKRQQQYRKLCDMDALLRKCDAIRRGLDDVSWRMSDVAHRCKTVTDAVTEWTTPDASNKDT